MRIDRYAAGRRSIMSAITQVIGRSHRPEQILATRGPWRSRPNPGRTTLGVCGVDPMNAIVVRMGGSACY
jgi:hypothetical protein